MTDVSALDILAFGFIQDSQMIQRPGLRIGPQVRFRDLSLTGQLAQDCRSAGRACGQDAFPITSVCSVEPLEWLSKDQALSEDQPGPPAWRASQPSQTRLAAVPLELCGITNHSLPTCAASCSPSRDQCHHQTWPILPDSMLTTDVPRALHLPVEAQDMGPYGALVYVQPVPQIRLCTG